MARSGCGKCCTKINFPIVFRREIGPRIIEGSPACADVHIYMAHMMCIMRRSVHPPTYNQPSDADLSDLRTLASRIGFRISVIKKSLREKKI